MSYPKWKYHKTESAKVVRSEAEEKALGAGWAESPAEFEVDTEETKPIGLEIDEMKTALKAAGFKDSQLKKKSEDEIRKLHGALVEGT
jgi:hypothetical protein